MLLHKADRTVKIIKKFTCHFTEFDQIFNWEHLITAKNKRSAWAGLKTVKGDLLMKVYLSTPNVHTYTYGHK